MDDERTGGRTAFDLVDPRYSFGVEGIGAQSVNGLSGEGDEPSGAEQARGAFDLGGTRSRRLGSESIVAGLGSGSAGMVRAG